MDHPPAEQVSNTSSRERGKLGTSLSSYMTVLLSHVYLPRSSISAVPHPPSVLTFPSDNLNLSQVTTTLFILPANKAKKKYTHYRRPRGPVSNSSNVHP